VTSLDLDAYLGRIRWRDPITQTHATLAALVDAHMSNIPFENLDVLLGRGVRLDLESLRHKLVHNRRGGYCFEHVSLFAAILEALGFTVTRHTARVTLFAPRTEAPRAHMILTVVLAEGTFVVDPGFGGLAPRVPVPLRDGDEVRFGHDVHWLAHEGDVWALRARTPDRVAECWVSPLDRDNPIDFDVGNHYASTYPKSAMVNCLMLRALTPAGRVAVMNREVTIVEDGVTRVSELADRRALRTLLVQRFGFDLPEAETLRVPAIPEWR
jgi:N-hydroxyarylamine O-acetyltransferase